MMDVMAGFRRDMFGNPTNSVGELYSNPLGNSSVMSPGFLNGGFSTGPMNVGAPASTGAFTPSFMDRMLGYRDPTTGYASNGWGGMALGAAQGILGGFLGLQQLNMAKDALKMSKEQFNKNFATQAQLANTQMEDRQRARVASNPGAYESVGSYMDKNRINY